MRVWMTYILFWMLVVVLGGVVFLVKSAINYHD